MAKEVNQLFGNGVNMDHLFQARQVDDKTWIGTDRQSMLIQFYDLQAVIEWLLINIPALDTIDGILNGKSIRLDFRALEAKSIIQTAMDEIANQLK